MVAPVNNPGSVIPLQRSTPPVTISQTSNRQVPQASANRAPVPAKASDTTITLASAKASPSSNLPRGSIVDKLV